MEIQGLDLRQLDLGRWWGTVRDFAAPRLLPSLAIAVASTALYWIARWTLGRIEERVARRTATALDDHVVRLVRRATLLSVVFWALWRLAHIWTLGLVAEVTIAGWMVAISVPLSGFLGQLLETLEGRIIRRTEGTLDDTALPLVNKVLRFLVVALGAVVGLDHLGVNIAPLLAGAGVMGLALSLAAKDTLSNLIAGVLLILDRPFRVGDRIELWNAPAETGTWGDVIEIGLRATKIRNPDNLVVVVPNNEIMRRDIINYTMSGSRIRLRIPVSIAYDADIELAKRLILEVAGQVEGVEQEPAPVVIVRGFGPSEVNLQLRVWIRDARRRRAIGDEITEKVKRTFDAHRVEIPYPKRDIYIRGDGPRRDPVDAGEPAADERKA